MAPTITSARSLHSTLACILLLFFAMVPISVHAQTYDLRVGTERYYNENGISNWFYGPHTGIRDFPVYHFESVIDETTAPETPKFNFPRQIGNVWVYSTAMSQGCADRACVDMRLALIDEIEVNGMSCSIFDLDHIKHRYSRTFTWCFEDDKILWPRTDIDPDTNRVDLVADFSQEEGGKWLLSNQLDPNAYYHVVRKLYHISESGSTYSFDTYGTDNLETLEYVASMKFVDHHTYHIGLYMEFRNNVGLSRYTHSMDGSSNSGLKGSYINGVLAGDTTFYYATSIDYEPGFPSEFELAAYPNPFNPTTQIRFTLPMESQVELGVYTVTGRRIATLVNEVRLPGTHQVTFDASDLASGVYIYRIRAGDFMQSGKMTLVK